MCIKRSNDSKSAEEGVLVSVILPGILAITRGNCLEQSKEACLKLSELMVKKDNPLKFFCNV